MNTQKAYWVLAEENWKIISQALASRNVMRPEIDAMKAAYRDSLLARFSPEEQTTVEFWVSDPYEQSYVKFLQLRDYIIFKKNCGLAVVK